MAAPKKLTSRLLSEWETPTGITPEVFTICENGIAQTISEYVEQGAPLSVALELAGVPEETYRDWAKQAGNGITPYVWAITLVNKAAASYVYTQVIELNLAEGATYRKHLEILKLRDGINWGGSGLEIVDESYDAEYL